MNDRCASLAALGMASMVLAPCRALAAEQSWSLDTSGELRERFESAKNPVFGLASPAENDYLLHRAAQSAEARRGDDLRGFVEVASGLTSGWQGPPQPTQEDPLDILQAFIEKSVRLSDGRLSVRAGRQAMALGSARLVSIRESTNIRRAFDGVRVSWARGEDRSFTAFYLRPVFPEDGTFDDKSSFREFFWGIYATWPALGIKGFGIDTYYLGLDRNHAVFAQGAAHELRHTVGVRAFGRRADWDWNFEAAWQGGSFGKSVIRAWTASLDAGFEFTSLPLTPRIGVKADAISGDEDPQDRRLGTFNPLYPRLNYFSEAIIATPANLLDLQPNVRLSLADNLNVTVSWDGLWKHEAADAFYAPPLSPIQGTSLTRSRDIGWQAGAQVDWRVTVNVELGAAYVTYEPSSVIRQAGGRSGNFFTAWTRWAF